jgi:hypothetical protein
MFFGGAVLILEFELGTSALARQIVFSLAIFEMWSCFLARNVILLS